jgi:hypothetical protein
MPEYTFGNYDTYSGYHHWHCNANTIELAIKLFKLECLWPETYLDKQYFNQLGEDGYRNTVRDEVTGIEKPRNIPPDAFIPIYIIDNEKENKESEKWLKRHKNLEKFPGRWYDQEPLAKLPLFDCIDVNYTALADTKLLPSPETQSGDLVEIPKENTALMEATISKPKAREYMFNIMKLQKELEEQRRDLAAQISKFEEIISEKKRILYAIETYMGLYEDVVQLKKGENADPDEPISVYQLKLFMDEEVGLVQLDGDKYDEGMDFQDLDKFDEWITEHYEQFIYYPKAVLAWQVRREKKNYDPNPFVNSMMNDENFHTYFLIRNGENLYRIDSNVSIPDVTFPTAEEFDKTVKHDQEWHHDGKDIKEFINKHMYVLIALQGLVDRTPIFGTNFAGKADFVNPKNFNSKYIHLVRDAETDHQIGDGRPTWYDFIAENRKSITVGTRVMIDFALRDYKEKTDRITGMSKWNTKMPDTGEIFIIQDYKKDRGYGSYGNYQIKYQPGGEVFISDGWGTGEWRPRKNKVSYWAYADELLNIDAINYDEINYYIHNRLYRRSYLTMLQLMRKAYRLKKEEHDAEEPFAKLLAKETKTSVKQAHDAIDWWKLKNKWKRSVSADESKAYRMIKRKLLHEELD